MRWHKKLAFVVLTIVLGLALIEGLVRLGMFAYDLVFHSKRPFAEWQHTHYDELLAWPRTGWRNLWMCFLDICPNSASVPPTSRLRAIDDRVDPAALIAATRMTAARQQPIAQNRSRLRRTAMGCAERHAVPMGSSPPQGTHTWLKPLIEKPAEAGSRTSFATTPPTKAGGRRGAG